MLKAYLEPFLCPSNDLRWLSRASSRDEGAYTVHQFTHSKKSLQKSTIIR